MKYMLEFRDTLEPLREISHIGDSCRIKYLQFLDSQDNIMLSFAVHAKRCLTTLELMLILFCYTHSASFSLHVPRKWCWQKSHSYQRRQIFWNQPCWMNSSVTSQRWLQFITNHRAHLWKVVLRQEDSHYLLELNLHQV